VSKQWKHIVLTMGVAVTLFLGGVPLSSADQLGDARQALLEARTAALSIASQHEQIQALLSIVRLQSDAGDIQAAQQTAALIPESYIKGHQRGFAERAIVQALAERRHIQAALRQIKTVRNTARQRELLVSFVRALAKQGNIKGALQILGHLESRKDYESGLLAVAANQQNAQDALKTARKIIKPRHFEKVASRDAEFSYHRALGHIASRLTMKGEVAAALKIADQLANEGKNETALEGGMIKRSIAGLLAEEKKYDEAFQIADALPKQDDKDAAYKRIAVAQIEHGDLTGAYKIATLIQSPVWRYCTMKELARAQMARGLNNEARRTIEEVMAAAEQNKDDHRVMVYRIRSVWLQAKNGDGERAVQSAGKLPVEDKFGGARTEALLGVAVYFAKQRDFGSASFIIKGLPDGPRKEFGLSQLARTQARVGLFDMAIAVTEMITDEREKKKALQRIAVERAKRGEFEVARQALQTLGPSTRDEGLWRIAKHHIETRQFEPVLELAQMIESGVLRGEIFTDYAWAVALEGDPHMVISSLHTLSSPSDRAHALIGASRALLGYPMPPLWDPRPISDYFDPCLGDGQEEEVYDDYDDGK
jgi:tetratricopeptide (TPR) repeat protein